MANWNPGATGTLGLQWLPIFGGLVNLDANNKMIATAFDQTASQAITQVAVPNVGIGVRGGIYALEVYDNEDAVAVGTTFSDAVPNEDVVSGGWLNSAGNTTSMFTYIDEGFGAASMGDYLRITAAAGTYTGRFNTGSFVSLTGKRILQVRLGVYATIGVTGNLLYGLNIGGNNYLAGGMIAGPRTTSWYYYNWNYNPNTKKPWTIADVQAFDTTDEFLLYGSTQPGWTAVDVGAVTLTIVYCNENRLAVGALDDSGSAITAGTSASPAWSGVGVLTPTGGAWTKDASGRHLYTMRRITNSGSISMPFFDTDSDTGLTCPIGRSFTPSVETTYGTVTAMNTSQTKMHPFTNQLAGPTNSADSQPYTLSAVGSVYTGRTVESEFSGSAATNYGILRFYAYTGFATGNMDIKIKRRSDNVQFGGTYTLTPAVAATFDPASPSSKWRLIQVQLPTPAALAAATQYYVEFSSSVSSTAPWLIDGISTNGGADVATFTGTTDAATLNGARNTSVDMLVTVATIPTAPAALVVGLGTQAVGETVACENTIERAELGWAQTSLGGSFLRYEIQRSEDGQVTWQDVARVTVESVVAWKDYEAQRGVNVVYRIRVVRTDNAFSPWTGSGVVLKPVVATGYMMLGAPSATVSTPDSASVSVGGKLDLQCRIQPESWTASSGYGLICKAQDPSQLSWRFQLGNGFLQLLVSNNGTAWAITQNSDVSTTTRFVDGQTGWVRATYLPSNPAGQREVRFYTAYDSVEPPGVGGWTQLGSAFTFASTGAVADSTAPLEIGAVNSGHDLVFHGRYYRALVYDGLSPDQYLVTAPATSGAVNGTSAKNIGILGDIDVRARIAPDVWGTTYFAVTAISNGTTAGWGLYIDASATGAPVFRYWSGGSDVIVGGVALPAFAATSTHWVRVTRTTSGTVTFYYAPDSSTEPTVWTLHNQSSGWTAALQDGGTTHQVASIPGILGPAAGSIYRVIVRAGVDEKGVIVAEFDANKATVNKTGTLYTSPTGQTYATTFTGAIIKGVLVASPDFTNPDARGSYYPTGLSDSSGNIWTAAGTTQWARVAQGSNAMQLVSNYNPAQNLAYEYRPSKDYAFNEAEEQQLQGTYGRDFQLGANPIENRGVTARWTLLVGIDDKLPSGGGSSWNAYTPLRNLARAAIPYVCVLDSQGNRMYAQLRVPNGSEDFGGGAARYLAEISGSEVAGVPYVVTVTS